MHVKYDINTSIVKDLLVPNLAGEGATDRFIGVPYQRGYGLCRRQRGRGIGTFLRILWKYLSPYAADVGKNVVSEGMESGARILQNIAQGTNVKDAVVTEGKQVLKKIAKKAGFKQEGSGIRKKRSVKRVRVVGRSVSNKAARKKRRFDSLGFY